MENSNIFFQGDNNILFIEDGVVLNNARIHFSGSNSLIYLRKRRHKIKVNLQIGQDSLLFVGKDNYFNDTLHISATEWQSVIVGNNCLFSFGIWLRTADPHLVYSTETNQRINHSKPILIGDHVWIGQDSLILKGTQIGSGSIVGGHSVVAGKKLPSNTIYGGNPAKQIRGGAFWLDNCTHTWTEERSKEWNCPPPPDTGLPEKDKWTYSETEDTLDMQELFCAVRRQEGAAARLAWVQETLVDHEAKDRFYAAPAGPAKKGRFWNRRDDV